jgi:hypothetical protein
MQLFNSPTRYLKHHLSLFEAMNATFFAYSHLHILSSKVFVFLNWRKHIYSWVRRKYVMRVWPEHEKMVFFSFFSFNWKAIESSSYILFNNAVSCLYTPFFIYSYFIAIMTIQRAHCISNEVFVFYLLVTHVISVGRIFPATDDE